MHDGDRDLFFIGKFLQFFLPQSIPHTIGTAAISRDQKLTLFWIECFSPLLPPPSEALDGKFGCIMINANILSTLAEWYFVTPLLLALLEKLSLSLALPAPSSVSAVSH